MTPPLRAVAAALRAGTVSARALTEQAVAARHAAQDVLDAYCVWAPQTARATAAEADAQFARGHDAGALQGIPVSVKDLFGLAGMPIHVGSPHRLPERFEQDGPIVAGLRAGGAVFTGKTHTSEVGFGVCGSNVHWGTPRNPWDADAVRPAGGSSSGGAISIVEGSALLALGSDTGGSAREPANMTGIVGLKVTYDRWPRQGLFPPGLSLHGPGLLARSVDDVAFGFAAIDAACGSGRVPGPRPEMRDADLRIGVLDAYFWQDCAPGVAEAVEVALRELAAHGARLVPCDLPEAREMARISNDWDWGIVAVELFEFLVSELPHLLETLHPGARRQLEQQKGLAAVEYLRRRRLLASMAVHAAGRLADYDVLVCPTSPIQPPLLSELENPETYRRISRLASRNACVANLLNLCALTMPVGLDPAGLPIGMQLMSGSMGEENLLAAAARCERILGTGADRLGRPPLPDRR